MRVSGVLVAIDRPKIDGKPVARFVMLEGDISDGQFMTTGDLIAFLGTADLINKIHPNDKGHFLLIVYEGVDSEHFKEWQFDAAFSRCIQSQAGNCGADVGRRSAWHH